jgi:AbrB family looped-hinge helix DNA binding protein
MDEINTTIDKNGRIVIPASFRRKLGVHPGDQVVLIARDDQVQIVSRKARRDAALERLRNLMAQTAEGRVLSQELIDERRRESERE